MKRVLCNVLVCKIILFFYVKSCCIYEMCFLENICRWFSTIAFIKFVWPYYCTYLLLFKGKIRTSPERRYACAIEKALAGKTVNRRDNGCGVCMSSMRSGQGYMVRDLPRGAVHAPLRKLSLEEANMFARHFGVVLVISSYVLYYVHACI